MMESDLMELHRAISELRVDQEKKSALLAQRDQQLMAVRAALAKYFDVDADDPRTDGGELELADAIHALEAIREAVKTDG